MLDDVVSYSAFAFQFLTTAEKVGVETTLPAHIVVTSWHLVPPELSEISAATYIVRC